MGERASFREIGAAYAEGLAVSEEQIGRLMRSRNEARQRAERAEADREDACEELQNLKASANAECWRLASEMRAVVAALRSISWLPLQVEQIMPVIDRLDAALPPSQPTEAGGEEG